jgi:plastocyanin
LPIWSNPGTAVLAALLLAACGSAAPVPDGATEDGGSRDREMARADDGPPDASAAVTPITSRIDAAGSRDTAPPLDAPADAARPDAPAVIDAAADLTTDLAPARVLDGGPLPGVLPPAPAVALAPCLATTSYVTGPVTISFPINDTPGYSPPCLKVPRGTEVTFTASSGDFAAHPLGPRTGGAAGSPITPTAVGTRVSFAFGLAGFFPYGCMVHRDRMFGVVWVTD